MGMLDIFRRKPKPVAKKRGFDGAATGRLFSDFVTSQRSADSELRYSLKTLRNRCRELARNNEYARRYLHLVKTNVVGERGASLQVKATNVDGSLDTIGNTIIEQECIDELADRLGRKADVAAITEKTMRGDIDFPTALRSRAAMVAGLPASIIDEVFDSAITFTPGGATMIATLRNAGIYTALVSGGFTDFTSRVRGRLGFDEDRANRLVIDDGGLLTGRVHDPILDSSAKRTALDELAARLGIGAADAAALGDGANDCDMIAHAGLGIGYRPKPKLAAVADAILHHADLTGVLYLMGFRETEFAAA